MNNTFLINGLGGRRLVTRGMAPVAAVLSLSPIFAQPDGLDVSATTRVDFYGTGSTWTVTPPTFVASGTPTADGAWSMGSLTVDSSTHAHLTVTTGPTLGSVFFRDGVSGSVVVLDVSGGDIPPFQALKPGRPSRPRRRWYIRGAG